MAVLNLHDAFLNASVMKHHMHLAPIEIDPKKFPVSDYGRLERAWIAYLYVLIEAWESKNNNYARNWIASKVSVDQLETALKKGHELGSIEKMLEVRHYMCHRDRREYWDDGRTAVIGQLDFHLELHSAFSVVLLKAVQELG